MKKLNCILFLIFLCHLLSAQNQHIDSLKIVLQSQSEDTAKVHTLVTLAMEYRFKNSDSAFYFINQALTLAIDLNDKMGIADSKRRMGAIYADLGKYNEGASSVSEALEIYKQLLTSVKGKEKDEILRKTGSAYNIIGQNRISQGNYAEGLRVSFLALKIREELGNKQAIADTKWNIGNIYVNQQNFPEALKYYTDCLKIGMQLGNKLEIADSYGAIGYVYFEMSNYTEAWNNYSIALKFAEEANDKFTLAELYNSIGELMLIQDNYNEALTYNFAALKTYEEIGITFNVAYVYNNVATIYMKQKKFKLAAEYLDKALSFSKKIGNLEYIKLSYQNLAMFDSIQGDYKKSLDHYKSFISYRDSLINKENTKRITEQQMQYDFDKKEAVAKVEQEKKDALSLRKLQRQKLVKNGFIGGFTAVLLFAGLFFTQRNKIKKGKKRSDELLLNILPSEVAEELKATGSTVAKDFEMVTVLFTDFKNFTAISEKLSAQELVNEINYCYSAFDNIITKHGIEKIKTIGDAYMCAGGLPTANATNAEDTVSAAIEIRNFIEEEKNKREIIGKPFFEIRIGCHTGPVVAGIVGIKKFAYDIWGDTVNVASRMESSGEAGKVNISGSTYKLVKDKYSCIHRGKIEAKNKGEIDMYFVEQKFDEV